MNTTCAHCHSEYDHSDGHNCTAECIHCGATYDELENPEYDSAKVAVSRHQRECAERSESWNEPIRDPEAEFRKTRRERERQRRFEQRLRRKRVKGQ